MRDTSFTLYVPGTPQGKGRPRFGNGRAYTDPATISAEQRIQAAWHETGRPVLTPGPLQVTVRIVVRRPKSHFKRDGTLTAEGHRHPLPVRKPDCDNALKLVLDALNGCAYRDDVDVVTALVQRSWSLDGREQTIIHVAEVGRDVAA